MVITGLPNTYIEGARRSPPNPSSGLDRINLKLPDMQSNRRTHMPHIERVRPESSCLPATPCGRPGCGCSVGRPEGEARSRCRLTPARRVARRRRRPARPRPIQVVHLEQRDGAVAVAAVELEVAGSFQAQGLAEEPGRPRSPRRGRPARPDLSPSWHPGSRKARLWLTARPGFLIFPAQSYRVPERRRTVPAYG
jgi:hypothetical protein